MPFCWSYSWNNASFRSSHLNTQVLCLGIMPRIRVGSLILRQIMKILYQRFRQRSNDSVPSSTGAREQKVDLRRSPKELPEDVKEGHFVVYTVNDGEPKRFIIRLDYLAHPGFVKLLELAAEEFGLRQAGVLAVPCRSVELQRILGNWRK